MLSPTAHLSIDQVPGTEWSTLMNGIKHYGLELEKSFSSASSSNKTKHGLGSWIGGVIGDSRRRGRLSSHLVRSDACDETALLCQLFTVVLIPLFLLVSDKPCDSLFYTR